MKKHYLLTTLLMCCLSLLTFAQDETYTLTGQVTNEEGAPLVGVNIVEQGTTNGTVTDLEGNYALNLTNPTPTLVFSFIGHESEEVILEAGQSELNMSLREGLSLTGIEVVGTRSLNRSVTESPVAVDIIPISDIANDVGQLDVNQLLQYVAPSFNANRQSGADGSDHIDPATLRGLGPDQTLVLLNGKRRHQSSLVNIFGTRGRGNTGTDLNAIPASAIKRIEILRDGASAQYGSDAIAGVINIVLKDEVNKFTGMATTGIYQEGDGEMAQISGNYGLPLGNNGGFVNMTADFLYKGRTNRPADPNEYDIYRRQFGDAEMSNFGGYFNAVLPFRGGTEFYMYGGHNYRDTDAFAWTRDADSDRNIPAIYPDGFDPHILSTIKDNSISAGVRGKIGAWNVDFNNTYGKNRFHYFVDGSLNASLLESSPTRFDAGGFSLAQNTTGLSFSRYFDNLLAGTNIAFGVEYRTDNYEIFAGEEASWRNYGIIDTVVNGLVTQVDVLGRAGGSQGFPGFQPSNELDEDRSNAAAYVDAEFDFTDAFMIAAAARFENYSDFGNTINGKLAARYEIMPQLALRGSVSTGFRAPSLPQIYFNTTFTDFVGGVPVDKIIAKNNSPLTRALGIPELKEETALNASVGLTANVSGFSLTVDGYYADIKDRIVLTGAFEDTDEDIGAELQALNVGAAQFFTNAIDTRTMGVDVILSYAQRLGTGKLSATLAANFNDMELGDITTSEKLRGKEDVYFGAREQSFLLASAPNSKASLTFDYQLNRLSANLRFTRFGKVELIDWIDEIDTYNAKITTDLSVGYNIAKNLSLTVGGANILNVLPDKQDTETETGGNYDPVQMGFNGAFFFGRLNFGFE